MISKLLAKICLVQNYMINLLMCLGNVIEAVIEWCIIVFTSDCMLILLNAVCYVLLCLYTKRENNITPFSDSSSSS